MDERLTRMRIGVDLGGTKTEAIVLGDAGEECLRHRVNSPQNDYTATLETICDLVEHVATKTCCASDTPVGIGIPGAISPKTGLVKNANSTWLIGQPFNKDLEDALGRPVRIENDANCFAVSEAVDGAGAGHETVFGVILGTGVGGGIATNKRARSGLNAIAGEWGHNPLPWPTESERPGPQCYCGKMGCIETFLSGAGLARDHFGRNVKKLTASEIALQARRGDQSALQCLERYTDRLARALATVINIVDPDIIVLGGGLSNIDQLYDLVPTLLPGYVFSDACDTPVVKNMHGDSSGVRGAAWLWPDGK